MPVVSNILPILNLAIVDQLDLMRHQFSQIQIPPAVVDELKIDEERPGSLAIRDAIADGWIRVQPTSNTALIQLLKQTLDGGEKGGFNL
jgi:predicted nucleic acid-binding protein